jgi:carbonic anhydrase
MSYHGPICDKGVPMNAEDFTPSTDDFLARNADWAEGFEGQGLPVNPHRHVAIVACMDSRMPIFGILGLDRGDAHIIRNAGGVVTDDVIRSLTLSQRALGTREIILIHHTDCGLQKVTEATFNAELEAELGVRPHWALESFEDPYADTRQSMQRLRLSPFVPYKDHIRGFVYDVDNGRLDEVEAV